MSGWLGLLEQSQCGREERQSESSCANFKVSLEQIRTQLDGGGERGVRGDLKVFCLNSLKDGSPAIDKRQTTGDSVRGQPVQCKQNCSGLNHRTFLMQFWRAEVGVLALQCCWM